VHLVGDRARLLLLLVERTLFQSGCQAEVTAAGNFEQADDGQRAARAIESGTFQR
jgi:hypothetical protein